MFTGYEEFEIECYEISVRDEDKQLVQHHLDVSIVSWVKSD